MVLPTAHRQGANVDEAETFGVPFGKELAFVISRNGHDWPTVVLNLGVAQSGVDHKFRMLIPVYLQRALFCTVVHRFPQKKRARPLAKKVGEEYSRHRLSREA